MTESNKNNDWEMVGKDIKKLQDLIIKLEDLVKENSKKTEENPNKQSTTVLERT